MTALPVLILNLLSSAAMAGIVWFVQIVHYPLFSHTIAGASGAADYHDDNVRRTRPVVLVPMVVEAASAAWLAVFPPVGVGRSAAVVGVLLVGVAILSTALVQVPLHARLRTADAAPRTVDALVQSNWIRTVTWSLRAVLAAWMLFAAVTHG
jgi:hypothetical protein